MDISGLDKAEVLAALYNQAKAQGMGFLQHTPEDMTTEDARELLSKDTYFDYVQGRVMKIRLDGDELNTFLYNRDNGYQAAEAVLERLIINKGEACQ